METNELDLISQVRKYKGKYDMDFLMWLNIKCIELFNLLG